MAFLLSLDKPEKCKGALEGFAKKLSVTSELQIQIPLSKRISERLIADPKFEGERKLLLLLLDRILELRLTGDEVGTQRMAKQLWPGIKLGLGALA